MMDTAQVITAIAALLATVSVGAIIKVIRIFLRHIDASNTRQETFLSNHLSANTRALEASARAQERVADRLERVEDAVHRGPEMEIKNPEAVRIGNPPARHE